MPKLASKPVSKWFLTLSPSVGHIKAKLGTETENHHGHSNAQRSATICSEWQRVSAPPSPGLVVSDITRNRLFRVPLRYQTNLPALGMMSPYFGRTGTTGIQYTAIVQKHSQTS